MLGAEDVCGHGRRGRLAVRRGVERHAERELRGKRVDGLGVELPENLPGQRRATSAAGGARESSDRPCGGRLQVQPYAQGDPFNSGEGIGWGGGTGCSELLADYSKRSKLIARWPVRGHGSVRACASTRPSSPHFARVCGGATRTRRSSTSFGRPRSDWAGPRRCASSPRTPMRECTRRPSSSISARGTPQSVPPGLFPRRFLTREDLLSQLRSLGEELGRTPRTSDLTARRGSIPSASTYTHTFGSLANALREAGFDLPVGEERLDRAVEQGARLARDLGRLPKMTDWADARRADSQLLSEWQVYRLLDVPRGAWTAFQYLVRERLREDGVDGSRGRHDRSRRGYLDSHGGSVLRLVWRGGLLRRALLSCVRRVPLADVLVVRIGAARVGRVLLELRCARSRAGRAAAQLHWIRRSAAWSPCCLPTSPGRLRLVSGSTRKTSACCSPSSSSS